MSIQIPINSDLSENVEYNNPNFPAYIKQVYCHYIWTIKLLAIGMMI